MHVYLQGVQEKLCFFTIHCNPSIAYIAVRDFQSSQRNTVTPIGWDFFVKSIAAQCWRGRGGKLREFLEKNTIFNEHLLSLLVTAGLKEMYQFKKKEN